MQEIEINVIVRAIPETHPDSKRPLNGAGIPMQAKVVYIHPEARYYVIEFPCPRGEFRETRYFTLEQKEARLRKLVNKRNRTRATATPPGYYSLPEAPDMERSYSAAEDFSTMF